FLSWPNSALPFTLDGVSCLRKGLPMILYSDRFFSFTFFGGSIFEASSTRSPYPIFLPSGLYTTNPFSAKQSPLFTLHLFAAVSISISLAVAPVRNNLW